MIEVGTSGLKTVGLIPTYEVVPGERVGVFQLGDNLWHVLEILRTHKTEYPKVEVSWDEDAPHKSAITIHLPFITLYFPPSPIYQILSLISISIPTSSPSSSSSPSPPNTGLNLTYETQVLSSSHMPLTRARVGRLMGPTFISKAGNKLDFPGITFNLHSSTNLGDVDGFGPREDTVSKIVVQPKEDEELQPKLISCIIEPNKGVTLALDENHLLPIIIGETTSQDLLLDLGAPLRKFWKEDDRLEKMWSGGNADSQTTGACFWNYFQYGLDFLISKDGMVIKILCHSNIPGTPQFQRYARCPWLIPVSSSQLDSTSASSSFRSNFSTTKSSEQYIDEIRLTVPTPSPPPAAPSPNNNGGGGKKKKKGGSPNITSISQNENGNEGQSKDKSDDKDYNGTEVKQDVREDMGQDAMMLDRLVEGGLDGVSGLGASKLIGFDGLIIEEDEKSGGICSVLVYKDDIS